MIRWRVEASAVALGRVESVLEEEVHGRSPDGKRAAHWRWRPFGVARMVEEGTAKRLMVRPGQVPATATPSVSRFGLILRVPEVFERVLSDLGM